MSIFDSTLPLIFTILGEDNKKFEKLIRNIGIMCLSILLLYFIHRYPELFAILLFIIFSPLLKIKDVEIDISSKITLIFVPLFFFFITYYKFIFSHTYFTLIALLAIFYWNERNLKKQMFDSHTMHLISYYDPNFSRFYSNVQKAKEQILSDNIIKSISHQMTIFGIFTVVSFYYIIVTLAYIIINYFGIFSYIGSIIGFFVIGTIVVILSKINHGILASISCFIPHNYLLSPKVVTITVTENEFKEYLLTKDYIGIYVDNSPKIMNPKDYLQNYFDNSRHIVYTDTSIIFYEPQADSKINIKEKYFDSSISDFLLKFWMKHKGR